MNTQQQKTDNQPHQLQMKGGFWQPRYIITSNKWFSNSETFRGEFVAVTGNATIYPDDDLLWIGLSEDEPSERFKTLKDFKAKLKGLPRWEATRYAIIEGVNNVDDHGRILDYALFPFDCGTGKPLFNHKSEIERLGRAADPIMGGKSWDFM